MMFGLWRKASEDLTLSDITAGDLQQCAEIHAKSFSDAWGDGTLNAMLKSNNTFGIVAKNRAGSIHDVFGFLIYRIAASEAEILTIATKPRARSKGIGGKLLDEMIRRCLTDRLTEIFLEVDENNQAALKLYRKHGFRKVGERKGYYAPSANAGNGQISENKAANALIMRLDLLE